MKRKTTVISVNSLEELPTLEVINALPRERILKIIFKEGPQLQREAIGANLKKALPNFLVGIHTVEPEINIVKLITDQEIEENQAFFEACAKDYRQLAETLVFTLANKLGLKLNEDFPMETFNKLKRGRRQAGEMENWEYFVHGYHCKFNNKKTGQVIEAPLIFGLEFGDLDPYFFTRFIKSTPKYHPLPVKIFEDNADGVRINEQMIALGKFERISANVQGHYGVVVTDRKK